MRKNDKLILIVEILGLLAVVTAGLVGARTASIIILGVIIIIAIGWAGVTWLSRYSSPVRWFVGTISVITIAIVAVVSIYIWSAVSQQRTVFFLLDASAQTEPFFHEIPPLVKLEAMSVPENVDIGLAVMGGQLGSQERCNDVKELISPASLDENQSSIADALDSLTEISSHGYAGLHESTKFAISQLASRNGIQQIFVLTSGIDSRCAELNRVELDQHAESEGVQIELIVVSVGEITEIEAALLGRYADSYRSVGMVTELPALIQEVLNSPPVTGGSYDRYYYYPDY